LSVTDEDDHPGKPPTGVSYIRATMDFDHHDSDSYNMPLSPYHSIIPDGEEEASVEEEDGEEGEHVLRADIQDRVITVNGIVKFFLDVSKVDARYNSLEKEVERYGDARQRTKKIDGKKVMPVASIKGWAKKVGMGNVVDTMEDLMDADSIKRQILETARCGCKGREHDSMVGAKTDVDYF
jgi:hypothetical protein